jgi:putative peptidoglycan lipid II flippase
MKSVREKIVKAAGLLLVLQVVGQATALLKQVVIAAQFGTSDATDSYLVATTVAGLILLWVGLPIRQTVVPMFRHDLAKRGESAAWTNVGVLFNNLLIGLIAIVVVVAVIAPYLMALLAPGFSDETQDMATSLTRITVAGVIFAGGASLLSQIFFSYERFFVPGIATTVQNLIVLVMLLTLGAMYGIYGLAAAGVLGAICVFGLHLPILWEKRKLYSMEVNLRHPQMAEMGKLGVPLLISTGGNELGRITDRIFASLLTAGSLSALAFAHRPITALIEFLVQPFHTATLPHFAKLTASGEFPTLSRQLFHYVRVIAFVTFPIAIGLMLMTEDVMRLLYQRGAFDESSVRMTSQALLFYAAGIPAQAIMRIFRTAFFNLKDTWTPTKIAFVRLAVKIALSWVLVRQFAHIGIAMAESVSVIVNALLLFRYLPKELKGEEGWRTGAALVQTLAVCLVMAAAVYLTRVELNGIINGPLELMSLVLLGGLVYGAGALVLQMEAGQSVLQVVRRLGTRYLPRTIKARS